VALPTEAWRGAEIRRLSAENSYVDLPRTFLAVASNKTFNCWFHLGTLFSLFFIDVYGGHQQSMLYVYSLNLETCFEHKLDTES
jgi:hypothetical protein